jgi:hypothetical protein
VGGAAILKQATAAVAPRAARRSSLERNPADYPGIKIILLNLPLDSRHLIPRCQANYVRDVVILWARSAP